LSVNNPLSSVTGITYVNGVGAGQGTVTVDAIRNGFQTSFTHFLPNSGYQLRNRAPYTFFAPLQSEMGDAYATGYNTNGEYGMGYRYDNNSFPGDNIYGVWDKIVFNDSRQQVTWNGQSFYTGSIAALSSCGASKALFVLGSNLYGQLGTGSDQQYYPTWTRVSGQWADIEMGMQHMLATNTQGHLYACGRNNYGQLGLGSGTLSANTLTLVDNTRNYVQLAASFNSTMVRDSNGFLYACGSNTGGMLGLGNKTSPVYSLTQEASGLSWSSVKGHKSSGGFLAISNKKLYGSGPYNTWNFGYVSNSTMRFKQEDRGWTDIITVDTGHEGTFIRRENQNNFYAVGRVDLTSVNNLALIDPSGTTGRNAYQFKETTVPSNASSISLHLIPGDTTECDLLYALNSKLYYKNPGNTFVQTNANAFNIFAGTSYAPVFVLLDGNRFRPTPTPTPTITLTPSPVPFQPLNVSQIGIFASAGRDSNDSINTNSYVNGIPGALNNALTQTFFLKSPISSGVVNHAYDYEKGNEYNRVVGIGFNAQDFNNNYPRYLYYHGGSYPGTKMSTEFNRGKESDYYGYDALMIAPPDPEAPWTSQGIYLYAYYFRYSSAGGEYRLATSLDRGVTWPLNGTFYGMETAYYNVGNGATCRPVFSMSRQRTATSRIEVRILFNGNFYFSEGNLHSRWPQGLVCKIAYPSGTGSLETVYNQINEYGRPTYSPWGYAFNHDYFNIPTAVSIGDSEIGKKILIHRRINGTWITDTVLSNITNACNRSNSGWSNPTGPNFNNNFISIEFNPNNPDIIYIAYILNSGASSPANVQFSPRRINVITYNMQTKTLIQDQKVISSIAGDPGYARITAVGAFEVPVDMPTLFYDTIAQKLYLYCYVAMINAKFNYYDSVFTTSTSDNINWSPLVQFIPTCQLSDTCAGRFRSNWDLKAKY